MYEAFVFVLGTLVDSVRRDFSLTEAVIKKSRNNIRKHSTFTWCALSYECCMTSSLKEISGAHEACLFTWRCRERFVHDGLFGTVRVHRGPETSCIISEPSLCLQTRLPLCVSPLVYRAERATTAHSAAYCRFLHISYARHLSKDRLRMLATRPRKKGRMHLMHSARASLRPIVRCLQAAVWPHLSLRVSPHVARATTVVSDVPGAHRAGRGGAEQESQRSSPR